MQKTLPARDDVGPDDPLRLEVAAAPGMRRTHDGIDCLTSTIGKAAKLDVYESDERNSIRFKPYRSRGSRALIDLIQPPAPQPRPVENKRSMEETA